MINTIYSLIVKIIGFPADQWQQLACYVASCVVFLFMCWNLWLLVCRLFSLK